jgi:hypothetical protein
VFPNPPPLGSSVAAYPIARLEACHARRNFDDSAGDFAARHERQLQLDLIFTLRNA